MKSFYLIKLFLFVQFYLGGLIFAHAQDSFNWSYNFEVFQQPFEQITEDTFVGYGNIDYWEPLEGLPLELGFSWEVMGEVIDELEFWNGLLIFFQPQQKFFYCNATSLIDRGILLNTFSLTVVLAQTTGEVGHRVFTLGLDNAGVFGVDDSEYINYQVRIYEEDNAIELHFGDALVFPESYEELGVQGEILGFFQLIEENAEDVYKFAYLTGDPLNPSLATTLEDIADTNSLIGTPPPGTVYRFTPVESVATEEVLSAPVSAWFTGSGIRLVSRELSLYDSYLISDLQGRVLLQGDLPKGDAQSYELNLPSSLSAGMYLVSLRSRQGVKTKKVVVDR